MIVCTYCKALIPKGASRCPSCDQEHADHFSPKDIIKDRPEFHTRLYVMAVIFIIGSFVPIFQSCNAMGIAQRAQADVPGWIYGLLWVGIGLSVLTIVILCFVMLGKRWARNAYLGLAIVGWVLSLFQGNLLQVIISILLFWFMFSKDWSSFNPEYEEVEE